MPKFYRCLQCLNVVRVMPGAQWPQPCARCGAERFEETAQPAGVRVCPYCDKVYMAGFGTCPYCEDRP